MVTFNENEVKETISNCLGNEYKKDIVKEISITKIQAKNGTTKEFIINRSSSKNNIDEFEFNEETEKVIIPKNTKNNTIIELKEKGNQYTKDDTRGNLYIKVKIIGNK